MTCRAIIFDFNGVIADDEAGHFLAFQQALAEDGLTLSTNDYYGKYSGMDERNCLSILLTANGGAADPGRLDRILSRKADIFRRDVSKPVLFPGAIEFIARIGRRYKLAVASGGRRDQIEWALKATSLENAFSTTIISAEDTTVGKPDPQIYGLALERLNVTDPIPTPFLHPGECLVLEDSKAGIQSAHYAGMKVAALATTYPADQLREADWVLNNWDELLAGSFEDGLSALFFSS
jgi:HAD superfamily hydrolase (TIGR01509 family)